MVQPLTGLTPTTAVGGFIRTDPEATAEERLGGTADPRHGIVGEVESPYPWEAFPGESHGPYGLENALLSWDPSDYVEPAGELGEDPTADLTPITHAAPWPKGVPQSVGPDESAQRRQESADIHSSNMGGSREALYLPTLDAQQDNWVELRETDPGLTFPAMQEIPSQLMAGGSAGWGSRDRVQSYARQNAYGFDSAHMHRRYADGSIPGNFLWMRPGGRPLVKSIPGTAKVPVGVDSPFEGQIPGVPFNSQGAALADLPASYQAPPDPALASGVPVLDAAPVDLW